VLQDIEKQAIGDALERNEWNKSKTARELCIHKNTLRRKILRLGITRNRE
jgi:DNA-binding NtrC family response regulator